MALIWGTRVKDSEPREGGGGCGSGAVITLNACHAVTLAFVQSLVFGFQTTRMCLPRLLVEISIVVILSLFNTLSPHDALKHHFTSLKTDLIFL